MKPKTYIEILQKKKKLISVEEYCNMLSDSDEDIRTKNYLNRQKNNSNLFEGMLKWEDDSYLWAGPYKFDYIRMKITKENTTKTEVDVFADMNKYVTYSWMYRANSVLSRVGFDKKYYTSSEMTEDEKKIVEDAETPEEHLFFELSRIKTLSQKDFLPSASYTIEHPYRIHLSGNDDCSYSKFYNAEPNEILNMETFSTLFSASWEDIKQDFHFTN